MEQGFDSLSLTQAAFAIGKEFSVKISFSQLMNQFPNIEMLAEHLDSTLPADNLAETPAIPTNLNGVENLTAPINAVAANHRLEEVVAEQAHTIARLVALLESAGVKPQASFAPALTGSSTPSVAEPQQDVSSRYAPEDSGAHQVESTIPQRGIFASSCLCQHLSAAYNESVTLRLTGVISEEKIKRAVDRLVERHDALRASFDKMGRTMKVATGSKIAPLVTDLSTVDPSIDKSAWQEQKLGKLIAEETALPFPIPAGPLFRAQIVLLGPDRAAIILTAHHLICDGWSLDVLIHDFCAFYSEQVSGAPASLVHANSYLDYVHNVTELQHSSDFNQAAIYWHRKFSEGFPMLVLPTDHPRAARRDFKARCSGRPISASVVQDLRALAAKQGCSFFTVLLSSLAILFARVSRQRRFVIALPTADQPVDGKPGLVGHCVKLLPFAVEMRDAEAFSEFLKRVQRDLLAGQDNASFTMVSLLDDLRPGTNAIGISPISAGFTSVKRFRPNELRQSGFTVDYDTNPKVYESFEFYLNAIESEAGLELRCHYDVQLFEDLTIGEWLADLDFIFKEITASPSIGISKLSLLDGANASAADVVLSRLAFAEASSHVNPANRSQETEPDIAHSHASGAVGPTDGAEIVIAAWLQELLGVEQVGLDDDFFALGGHSLTAVRLFSRIRKTYELDLELAILFEARTVRKLGAAIRKRKEPSSAEAKKWSSLVPIQPNGSRAPIFCVHAVGGDVIFYEQLARALGTDQPFYAFQSPLVSCADIRETSIEKLASTYVSDLMSFFPQGPYLIGGASFGGLVAFEMARQLHALGAEPDLLLLFDTAVPGNERHVNVKNQIGRFHDGLLKHGAEYLKKKARVKGKYWADNLRRRLQLVACACYRLVGRRLPLNLHYFQVAEAHKQAQKRYAFRPYAGKIVLMRAVNRGPESLSKLEESTLGWGALAGGGLEIHDVKTGHMFMLFEPYVKTFVEQLKPLLRP